MATIQSNIGLITGMAIGDTVDALMELAAKPREMLAERTEILTQKQTAVTELSAYLYAVRIISDNLGKTGLFDSRTAESSNKNVLTASASGDAPEGVYYFTSVRSVQNNQFLSQGVCSESEPLGGGTFSFRFGDNVERSLSLGLFDGGQGFKRGLIRITDRSGTSAQIDLSTAQTIDDVLDAINGNTAINVTAVVRGDGLRLIDNTGQSVSKLIVQEVSGGTTAASLGLDEINVAASAADSKDMIRLDADLRLDDLNDGAGVGISDVYAADVYYELRDGTTGSIDFSPRVGSEVDEDVTLGDLIDRINAAAPGKLQASIAPDGDRLVITDLTDNLLAASLDTTYEADNDGSGVIDQAGSLGFTAGGSESQAASLAVQLDGVKNDLFFEVGQYGEDFNGIEIILVDNEGETDEATAEYDAGEKTLTISINCGATTAATVTAAVSEAFGFGIESAYGLTAVEDLGLGAEAVDGVITGRRILGGVQSVLLSSLNGGKGYGELGILELTDRSGLSDSVDLSEAETLEDLIEAINAADVNILARVNQAKNGIELVDQTGMSASNLVVANGEDGAETADKLGIAIDAAAGSVSSGDMHMQVICANTKLADLGGGQGVASGYFTIVNTAGMYGKIDLSGGDVETVGDLIAAVNRLDIQVVAEINDTGDGILIRDLAGGGQQMRIVEGNSTTAADLHLLGEVVEVQRDGQTFKAIDGSMTQTIALEEGESLEDLAEKINELAAGVRASIFYDGSNNPYRLTINSQRMGEAGQLVIDASELDLDFEETAEARDALLVYGSPNNPAKGILVSSSSNEFTDILPGLDLQIKDTSGQAVMITVQRSDTDAVANVEALVGNYNRFRERLNELTEFNEETGESALLFGDSTALRLDVDLSRLISGRFLGTGSIQSLAEAGLSLAQDGTLEFDSAKFSQLFAKDPDALAAFFAGNTSDESSEDYGIFITEKATDSSTAYTSSVTVVTVDHELLNERYSEDPKTVMAYLRGLVHGGTLEEFGITVADGQVQIDETIFRSKYLSDATFADNLKPKTTGGVSNAFAAAIEKLCGEDVSLMTQRLISLSNKIDANESRLERMDKILELQRERLYTQFYNMELAIAKLQNNYTALESLQILDPISLSD